MSKSIKFKEKRQVEAIKQFHAKFKRGYSEPL